MSERGSGRTTRQIEEALQMASGPIRIIYVWPAGSPLGYPLRLFWKLLPSNVADFRVSGPYSFEITYTGATVEIVSSGKSPWVFLSGIDPRNVGVVIDHAVDSAEWDAAVSYLAHAVAASMEARP